MHFHHVLVSLEPEPTRLRCVLTDLSEEELHAKFVRPYRKGQNLICGNEVVPIAHIRKVHIVRTARESEVERRAIQEKSVAETEERNRGASGLVFMNLGRGRNPEDILEAGQDVTSKYVLGPPGSASEPNLVARLMSNQWTVAIGTGLVVAGVVWWLGWS